MAETMARNNVAGANCGERCIRQPIAAPNPWLAAWTLCRREWVRFVRQRNRVFGAIGQPLIFWLLFGAGFGPSFQTGANSTGGLSYREYFFPGTLVLILLFTAIFATISIIEDRREGFLQSVLVAPIPRWSMVLGKLLGGTLIAVAQGSLFLLLGLHAGICISAPLALAAIVAWMFVVALSLDGAGLRDRLADGFDARFSRHHERVADADVAACRGRFFRPSIGWLRWIMFAAIR